MHQANARMRSQSGVNPPPPRNLKKKEKQSQSQFGPTLSLIAADALVSCLWVLISSIFAEVAEVMVANSELAKGAGHFTLNLGIVIAALVITAPVCGALGGAMFNPVNNMALIVAGKGSAVANTLRMGGQLLGGLLGALLAVKLVPAEYQDKFHFLSGGLVLGVPLAYGFACEFLLGAFMNWVFLETADSLNSIVSFWLPTAATGVYVLVGSFFTGPSLNPMISFGWFINCPGEGVCNHAPSEHVILFWIAPFLGAAVAGLLHRHRHAAATPKRKPKRASIVAKSRSHTRERFDPDEDE